MGGQELMDSKSQGKKAIMGHFKGDPGGPVDAGLAGTSIKNAQHCVYRVEMRKFVFIGLPSALGR